MSKLWIASAIALVPACTVGDTAPASSGAPQLTAIRYTDKQSTPVAGAIADAALAYMRATPELTLSTGDDWAVRNSDSNAMDGLSHVRMQQLHDGIKVWGGDVVLHASGATVKKVDGSIVTNLDGFDDSATLDPTTALGIAEDNYAAGAKDSSAGLDYSREATELVILPLENRDARLAWHATFYTELQGGMAPGLWSYFVDAKTGEIIRAYNTLDTLEASGPGGNAKVSRTWTNNLDVVQSGSSYVMNTAQFETTNLNHATSGTGTPVSASSLTGFSDAAENDAHGFAEATIHMLHDWMGYNSIDNQGFKIISRVHYSSNYENAYWDGTQMTYGDGGSTFYEMSGAADVVGHEIDHGFTQFHSNLDYTGMSGGDNESFSDIAGTITEWYLEGTAGDWLLGEDIFKSTSGALRYMCNPTQDGGSIDNAANYNSSLDVHYTSGVMNKAFCLAAKRFGSGSPTGTATPDSVKRAGQAWYAANANYWHSSDTFTQACQGVVDAATALGYSATEIGYLQQSWADVGVTCGSSTPPPPTNTCDETLTTASGTIQSPNYPSQYGNNYTHTWCIQPSSGAAATLSFDAFSTESGYDFVTITDANGTQLSKTSGTTKPANATSTKLIVKFTSDASVTSTGFHASWSTGSTTNHAPTVSITAPTTGSTVSGSVTVTATAADSDGSVAKVHFAFPDGTSVDDTTAPYSATWNSATVADGNGYAITAVATDNLGATSSTATSTVNVHNSQGCISGTFSATGLPVTIPDNNSTGITSQIAVSGTGNIGTLALSLHITHTYRGDLVVTLTSPAGTVYTISNRSGGSADNIILSGSVITAFNGQAAAGNWILKVKDLASQDIGTLDSWSLEIGGDCQVPTGWSASGSPNMATVDNGSACTSLTVATDGNAADAKLDLSGTHDYRSILRGTLAHNGATVEAFPVGTFANGPGTFTLSSRAVAGLSGSAMGTWTLCIVDTDAYGDTGNLATWSVHN